MKIAIYHNLEKGGGLKLMNNVVRFLATDNDIDIYCHQIVTRLKDVNYKVFKLKKTHNIFAHLKQIYLELHVLNKTISVQINKNNYDLVLVFQCNLTQAPYLLRYLNRNKMVYFLNEPKREFYEVTSHSFNNPKKFIARILRYGIKYVDILNTKFTKNIITCSYYSNNQIKKIYNKESFVIYPGLVKTKATKIIKKNNKELVTIGQFQKTKGHLYTFKQIYKITDKIYIFGNKSEDESYLYKQANKLKLQILRFSNYSDVLLKKSLNRNSIYLANNEKEPFGISTLEAASSNIIVVGKNEAGTSEILNNINPTLYNNLYLSKKILKYYLARKQLIIYKTCKIDWSYTVKNIQEVINFILNKPNA